MKSHLLLPSRKRLAISLLLAGAAAGTAACSSSSSPAAPPGGPPGGPPDPQTVLLTGVFIDSAVANIGYRTETQEDVTNADGEFKYVDGESVVFFVGELELPPVVAKPVVTPLDIAGTTAIDDPVVVNIARLLQSLDQNGDPDDGIQIPDTAADYGFTVDFTVSPPEFENNAVVINLVANSGSVTTALVSSEAAIGHLTGTLAVSLVGSWRHQAAGVDIVLSFLPNGEYMHAEIAPMEGSGWPGIEHGTYSWNPLTGALTVQEVFWDTNGDWGLSDIAEDVGSGETLTLTLSEDGNQLFVSEFEEHDGPTFERIPTGTGTVVGTWALIALGGNGVDTSLAVATFLEDGQYFVAQSGSDDIGAGGQAGIEYGAYEWDADSGEISITEIAVDTNGTWGLSDQYPAPEVPLILQPVNGRLYLIEDEEDEIYLGEVCAGCEVPDWS